MGRAVAVGRDLGVVVTRGERLGVGDAVGVVVGVAVAVAVGVDVGVSVGVGLAVAVGVGVGDGPDCAQYLPPVFRPLG